MPVTPRRLIRSLANRSSRLINQLIDPLECALGDGSERPLTHRPILIVGPPRSGSTLLMQVLIHTLDVGYLTNAHERVYGAPSLAEHLIRLPKRDRAIEFESHHGKTQRWLSPHECGAWWYRFFRRRPQYVPLEGADQRALRRLRAAVRRLGDVMDRPVLFKNLPCAVRLGPISAALPEALFLVTHRRLEDNARSLLHGRARRSGRYDQWWSTEPPTIDELTSLPPAQQVVRQIADIHAQIDRDREAIGPDRFMDVPYDELCRDPAAIVERVQAFAASRGTTIARRAEPPTPFEIRRPEPLPDWLEQQLAEALEHAAPRE